MNKLYGFALILMFLTACSNKLEKQFKNPPNQYKPMPFWHINGELINEGIVQQITDAKEKAKFNGVVLSCLMV